MAAHRRNLRPAIAALFIGGTAYVGGFVGPIVLNPESNQGPLFGLCMSGPLGVAAGVALGYWAETRQVSRRRFAGLVVLLTLIALGTTLIASLPPDQYRGYVIDAEVVRCDSSNEYSSAVLTMHVFRQWWIYEQKKPWNRGRLIARENRHDIRTRYLAPHDAPTCGSYPAGTRNLYSPAPDTTIRENIHVLGAVPQNFRDALHL